MSNHLWMIRDDTEDSYDPDEMYRKFPPLIKCVLLVMAMLLIICLLFGASMVNSVYEVMITMVYGLKAI